MPLKQNYDGWPQLIFVAGYKGLIRLGAETYHNVMKTFAALCSNW